MRKHVKVATLSLAVFAGACGSSKEKSAALPEDLQKDLATASAPASDLAPSDLPTIPEPVATAPEPGAEPAPLPVPARGGSGADGGLGQRGRGRGIGGLGGILGGIIGGVVIRGGHGGVDKCDPRTDGRTGGIFIMGPNSGMPLPTGTFPRRFGRRF